MISASSLVIFACRARLYSCVMRLDDLVGVFGGRFHRHPPGDLLADSRVEQALEQPDLERHRQDFFEDAGGVGHEFVFDPRRGRPAPGPWPTAVNGNNVSTTAACRDALMNFMYATSTRSILPAP